MGVTLRDERACLEATFLPGAGMLCSSLRHRGEELLAQNRGVEAYVERGKTMGIPLLYPWANRLATAPANALRSGDDLRLLAPGECCRAAFVVRCE